MSEKIIECAELEGKCHDLGKYTKYFQKHIRGEKVPQSLYKHSELSAILGSWIVYNRLRDDFLSLVAFLCISSHHGKLKSLKEIREEVNFLDNPDIIRQASSIRENLDVISEELKELGLPEIISFIKDFDHQINKLQNILNESATKLSLNMKLNFDHSQIWYHFYIVPFLFSCLVDADKKDAGKISEIDFSWKENLSPSIVPQYIENNLRVKKDCEINKIRQQIFSSVDRQLNEILSQENIPKIMTITAPTGSGKTLLSLYVALRLREKMRNNQPRIIYCLPYINIIEQTHDVIEHIFQDFYGEAPLELLLKHHHLFFPTTNLSTQELTLDRLLLVTDSWESEVIVTTFEQLFRSIIGSRNASLKKLHNIANSILILDEVQAIPLEYWKIVKDSLENLANHLNVIIIIMTATMPTLLRSGMELVPDNSFYFKRLRRTVLSPYVAEAVSVDGFVNFFLSKWKRGRSALIVLNTVRTSKKVYRKLAEKLGDNVYRVGNDEAMPAKGEVILAYLSTSVIPKVRKERIRVLKCLLNEGYTVILVSTQVVEAGVDLDFDIAFRDLGPLDSIVQVAGRCNRNWRRSRGEVFVLRVVGDDGKEDSRKIYGTILPGISLELFKSVKDLSEEEVLALVEKYYDEILYRINAENSEESEKVLENVKNLNYGELDFSLIEEEPKIPVYIEYDAEANKLLEDFQNCVKNLSEADSLEEVFTYRAHLRRIRAEMENYIVEVYQNDSRLADLKPIMEKLDVRYIPRSVLEAYYDKETGFINDWEAANGETLII